MGKLLQGILGGVSGRVGNVVGSSWKGIPVIKSRPLSVANPRTAAQVMQRTAMSNTVAFVKPIIASVIKPLWDRFAQQQSGYNAFTSANIGEFESNPPATPSNVKISAGKMAATPMTSVEPDSLNKTIKVSWAPDAGQGLKLASDVPYIVAQDQSTGEVFGENALSTRASNTATINAPAGFLVSGNTLSVWLAFRRADGTVVSNSSYKEDLVTA